MTIIRPWPREAGHAGRSGPPDLWVRRLPGRNRRDGRRHFPAGLARSTLPGLGWFHPARHPRWTINGFWPDIGPAGAIAYTLFARRNVASRWIWPSRTGHDKIIYRWPHMRGSVAQVFGPQDKLAVMPIAVPLPKGKPGVVIRTTPGTVVRRHCRPAGSRQRGIRPDATS